MVQYDRIIIILFAVLVTVPVMSKNRLSGLAPASAVFLVSSSSRGYVRVSGDVRHPGIYPITANMMTVDAIQMAEPLQPPVCFISHGCEEYVVKNGTSIMFAWKANSASEMLFGTLSTAHRIVLGIPLDINVMTAEDLDRIPGVGPVLSKRIIEYRQTNGGEMNVESLLFIEGIGEKKYIHLSKYFNRP